MKEFTYLRYFFYIGFNWNFKIAWHIFNHERRGEKKYGLHTSGIDELNQMEKNGVDIEHATIYMPASYDLLEELFHFVFKQPIRHFLDIGCGKGRAVCVAGHYGAAKSTGIDFSTTLCTAAKENCRQTKDKTPSTAYEIINNDAFYFEIPEDVDCLLLFNPFDEVIMSGVVDNIQQSLHRHPRKLFIIYINPLYSDLFEEIGCREIYHTKKLRYLEASVYEIEKA